MKGFLRDNRFILLIVAISVFIVLSVFARPAVSVAQAEKKEPAATAPAKAKAAKAEAGPRFDEQGNLVRPEEYRAWMFVGSEVTPNDLNNGHADFPEFHIVYINPSSFGEYKKTGKFPDGTVMVKELVSVGAKQAPSGNGYFMGNYQGLAASVKDSKRFPKEPGNWAYFNFTEEGGKLAKTAKAQPTASCNACHQASAADDWVFTQYYPWLKGHL
ncbi:MAG: cytochrome P460 family protein [Methanothrix sp.]|nr:cytochrome P460 family protein [Methanothrix sp.]